MFFFLRDWICGNNSFVNNYPDNVILSFVNNYPDNGEIKQYVDCARERGQTLQRNDESYINSVVKEHYKNHIKVLMLYII